jgi:hypothetical protein
VPAWCGQGQLYTRQQKKCRYVGFVCVCVFFLIIPACDQLCYVSSPGICSASARALTSSSFSIDFRECTLYFNFYLMFAVGTRSINKRC